MKPLDWPDAHHLTAAEGWLELGNHLEANEELEQITPTLRAHPQVLLLRLRIYERAKQWAMCVEVASACVKLLPKQPEGWISRSFALHELQRTQEAHDHLLPAAEKFPKLWTVPYNLACYCAQLGKLEESKKWFQRAMTINEKEVQRAAIDDPDLQPLWDSLSGTLWKRE